MLMSNISRASTACTTLFFPESARSTIQRRYTHIHLRSKVPWVVLLKAPFPRKLLRLQQALGRGRPSNAAGSIVDQFKGGDEIPVPVLSANNPFAKCTATNLRADGLKLEYDIVCLERGAARGDAVYELSPNAFNGRVAMVMAECRMVRQ